MHRIVDHMREYISIQDLWYIDELLAFALLWVDRSIG